MPEFLYAYDEDGVRFEDAVLGTGYPEHWYNPRLRQWTLSFR